MIHGIDVSTHQGTIDWKKVKASGRVDFAMIKATQGRGESAATKLLRRFTDGQFKKNITGASASGIPCGVYHYMTAQNVQEAYSEAQYFIDIIAPYRNKISLWAAVDVESVPYLSKLPRPDLTRITKAFMERIAAEGYKPMLYTNPDHLTYRFTPNAFDTAEIWLAHWGTANPVDVPGIRIWQYGAVGTDSDVRRGWATIGGGRIPGINAGCDVNHGYFELPGMTGPELSVGDSYTIQPGDLYSNGIAVPASLVGKTFTVLQLKDDRILLREIMSWVKR